MVARDTTQDTTQDLPQNGATPGLAQTSAKTSPAPDATGKAPVDPSRRARASSAVTASLRARSGSERGKAGTASRADPSGSGPSQAGPTHAGAATSPESAERHARLLRLERLARNLDSALRLPGTPIRFGWDSIVGIIPGVGDTVMLLPALWIVMEGWRMGVRKRALSRMAFNTGADWLMGSVPLLGDIFDIGWKGNLRNVAVIRRELEREMGRSSRR